MMENKHFDRALYETMRIIPVTRSDNPADLTDELLADAVSFNDSLIGMFNIAVDPDGLMTLARHNAFAEFIRVFSDVFGLDADRKLMEANAMYTAFRMRTIDELTFRFHQFLHYMSTYGAEVLTGQNISKGWLPDDGIQPEKTEEDAVLRNAEAVSVIFSDEKYDFAYKRVVSARNRATRNEQLLLNEAVPHVTPETILSTRIAFKENLIPVAYAVFSGCEGERRTAAVRAVCPNTNDVFRLAEHILNRRHWKLSTSEKRALVRIFECYPAKDFAENMVRSMQVRESRLTVLRFLDYNRFSRSKVHQQAVDALRSGTLKSWESGLKKALAENNTDLVVRMVSSRPGIAVRYANVLMKQGVSADELLSGLSAKAGALSVQTLTENISLFRQTEKPNLMENREALADLFRALLSASMKQRTTPLRGKKVFLQDGEFDFDASRPEFNTKAASGTFISSGLARRVNFEGARYLRIFAYWENDSRGRRVDIDLHAYAVRTDGVRLHIGWNSDFRSSGIIFSGDITHSDPYGCEFIDVDLKQNDLAKVVLSVHSFTGQQFSNIRNCRIGITVVSEEGIDDDVMLYSPKNCLFSHTLDMDCTTLHYGFVDLKQAAVFYLGQEREFTGIRETSFSLREYLNILAEAQEAEIVPDVEEADVVLTLTKAVSPKDICLIDMNYFADAPAVTPCISSGIMKTEYLS